MAGKQELRLRPEQQAFVERFVRASQTDDRVLAAFLGGSNAKGTRDEFSDLDLTIITSDSSFESFYQQRREFLGSLGELVFHEDFGVPNISFFIFGDGLEGELYLGSENRLDHIRSGPFRILLDKKGMLADAAFPERQPDRSQQIDKLRNNIYWFWHEFSHFTTALGRDKLWWARGQLDQLRSICVNLARLQNNFFEDGVGDEPYFKIEYAMDVEKLSPLQDTFCPIEKDAMLQAAQVIVQFYKQVTWSLAQTHNIDYPQELEAVMMSRFQKLSGKSLHTR